MADGDFLACYLTSDFMALSFQKKLIENVIDAYKSDKSLADDPTFTGVRAPKKSVAAATIYTRMKGMMGWTEFDMKMKDDFIYFSGITHDADTCFAFIKQLRQQQSVKGFPGEALPSTAFYFSRQGITDWASLLSYGNAQEQNGAVRTSEVQNRDKEFSRYLMENAGQDLVACLFQREDTLQDAAAVLSLSVADVTEAERMLRAFVNTAPADEGRKTPRITFCYTVNKAYLVYRLPQTTLFKQLTSFVEPTLDVYAAFYGGRLLLAPDEDSLSHYIRPLDKGEVLNGAMAYQTGMDHLSDSYHFMLMADFDHVFRQSENHVRFVPDFFMRNADFFRNFTLFVQFACTDGVVYPNIVLKYKSE